MVINLYHVLVLIIIFLITREATSPFTLTDLLFLKNVHHAQFIFLVSLALLWGSLFLHMLCYGSSYPFYF